MMGSRLRSGLLVSILPIASAPAGATDIPIPGKIAIVKDAKLVRFVSKPTGAFVIPTPLGAGDPTQNPSSVSVFDTDLTGSLSDGLTGGTWVGLGNPAGSTGCKYMNAAAPSAGAVKIVLLKER